MGKSRKAFKMDKDKQNVIMCSWLKHTFTTLASHTHVLLLSHTHTHHLWTAPKKAFYSLKYQDSRANTNDVASVIRVKNVFLITHLVMMMIIIAMFFFPH